MTLLAEFGDMVKDGYAFYRKLSATNSFGETEYTWPTVPNVATPGVLRQLTGRARFYAAIHGFDADHRFYCDGTPDIQPGDRMEYAGKRYEVKSVNDVMGLGEGSQVDMLWLGNDGTAAAPTRQILVRTVNEWSYDDVGMDLYYSDPGGETLIGVVKEGDTVSRDGVNWYVVDGIYYDPAAPVTVISIADYPGPVDTENDVTTYFNVEISDDVPAGS